MHNKTGPTVIIPTVPGNTDGAPRRLGELAHLPKAVGDMDTETFRAAGHALIDWMADERASVGFAPIQPQISSDLLQQSFAVHPPLEPTTMDALLSEVRHLFLPGMTRHHDPRCLTEGATSGAGPALLGEMLTALLSVPSPGTASPTLATLERRVVAWWREMLGLPPGFVGTLHDCTSSATLAALASARDAALPQAGAHGKVTFLRYYCSQEAHPSLLHVAHLLGLQRASLRFIATDEVGALDARQLLQAIEEDLRAGWFPCAVIATLGTVVTGSLDPLPEIGEICTRFHLWLHVDAGDIGGAAIDPTRHWLLDGCQDADSLVLTPWFVGASTTLLFTPHAQQAHDDAFLPQHRWLALPLWMLLRSLGQVGLVRRVREQCRLAQEFAQWIEQAPTFELLTSPLLTTLCFRARPPEMTDEKALHVLNEWLCATINASGRFLLSACWLRDRYALKITIRNLRTHLSDLQLLWVWLQDLVEHAHTQPGTSSTQAL